MYDIFQCRWRDGGLTLAQLNMLYEDVQKSIYDKFVLDAKLQGINFDEDGNQIIGSGSGKAVQQTDKAPIFPDPGNYDHLSAEKKKEVTKKLMHQHRMIVGGGGLLHPRKNPV